MLSHAHIISFCVAHGSSFSLAFALHTWYLFCLTDMAALLLWYLFSLSLFLSHARSLSFTYTHTHTHTQGLSCVCVQRFSLHSPGSCGTGGCMLSRSLVDVFDRCMLSPSLFGACLLSLSLSRSLSLSLSFEQALYSARPLIRGSSIPHSPTPSLSPPPPLSSQSGRQTL